MKMRLCNDKQTILWHDYETWGTNPKVDFPVQFAAIRTDVNLNAIETCEPINLTCAITHDYLPRPGACLVTGLVPQVSLTNGMPEPIFAKKVFQQMSQPNTCVVGYNSIKFDEEVSRNLFYRNFYPIYDREFKNGNSRWDIIDLMRACYALRPEGVNWPYDESGKPSFKLERLAELNNIGHQNAHDALSDVYATIDLARLVKNKQPKLYDYYWNLRHKSNVSQYLSRFMTSILVYVSGNIPASLGCCTLVTPICASPQNNKHIICIDLNQNLKSLDNADLAEWQRSLFTNDKERMYPRLYSIPINKCPFVAPLKTLNDEQAAKHSIDKNQCINNLSYLQSIDLESIVKYLFASKSVHEISHNIDENIYASEFPNPADIDRMKKVRDADENQITAFQGKFDSDSLNERLFKYRGRHYPISFEEHEIIKWQNYLRMRFNQVDKLECLSLMEYLKELQELQDYHRNDSAKINIIKKLFDYGRYISEAM